VTKHKHATARNRHAHRAGRGKRVVRVVLVRNGKAQ
jgi:hypothetical protein